MRYPNLAVKPTLGQLGVDRFAIGAVHYSALGKAEGLLIKVHRSRYIGDGKHGGYGAELFFVKRINLLSHCAAKQASVGAPA